jgi:hypothetical protein
VHNGQHRPPLAAIPPAARTEIHRAAARIANRIAFLLQPALRRGEHEHAVRSIYTLAREELEAMTDDR